MWKGFLSTDAKQWATIPLRIALGVIFLSHGGQKLFGWLGGKGLVATAGFFAGKLGMTPGMLWAVLAGIGEFGGGSALAVWLVYPFGRPVHFDSYAGSDIQSPLGNIFHADGGRISLRLVLLSRCASDHWGW
jgi:hypothetical protein